MNRTLARAIRVAALAGITSVTVPAAVRAQQTAPAQGTAGPLEEIVVTAQKRAQSDLEVPVAITAFSAADIERAGIRDFEDYATMTPNVGFTQQGSRAYTKISIRGITNIGGKANSVGVYLDEFNIAPNILVNGYSRTADTNLFEVSQIEVLRGPQGTYFGRNTMGGAISITSKKPELGKFAGSAGADINDRGGWLLRGGVDIPAGDKLAFGVSGYYEDVRGFLDNKGPSNRIDDGSNTGARVALRFEPTGNAVVDLLYLYSDEKLDTRTMVPSGDLASIPTTLNQVVTNWPYLWQPYYNVPPINTSQFPQWPLPTTNVPFVPHNYDKISTNGGKGQDSTTDTVIGRIAVKLADNIDLTSVAGYINNDFSLQQDGDMSPYPSFTVSHKSQSDGWSEELRLSSFGNKTLDWTLGGIYSSDKISETDVSTHLASDPYLDAWGALLFALGVQNGQIPLPLPPDLQFALENGLIPSIFGPMTVGNFEDVDRTNQTDSWAVFGDLTWHATERLDMSLGLRYTKDDVTFKETARPSITLPTGTDKGSTSFDNTSPRINANFRITPDMSLYATISEGYKTGGINSTVTAALPAVDREFKPETGWNYEVGYKSVLAGDRLQLNAALFYFDWKDLQVRGQDVLTQLQYVQNATSATSKGFELEINAALTDDLQFRGTYGYLDAKFGNFKNALDLDGNLINASGNTIPYAPGDTVSLALDWSHPLGSNTFYAYTGWTYTGKQYFDVANSKYLEIPAFDVLDLRVGLMHEKQWDASLWLRNALDEKYILGADRLETYYSGDQVAVGEPRTFGASLRYRF